MAVLSVKDLRARLQTALAALSGWRAARTVGDVFGLDPNSYAHQAFAVDAVSTTDLGNSRQHAGTLSEGARCVSEIRVRWTYRLKPKAQSDSLSSAYDAETAIRVAVMGVARSNLHLRYLSAARIIEPRGEWLIGDLRFSAIHTLSLE